MMNLQLLEYFAVIAETGSYSNASKKLFVSQPALSVSIKKLEDYFDVDLFTKKGRAIELTQAGKILYKQTKKIQQSCTECQKEMSNIKGRNANYLRIGMSICSNYDYFLHLYTSFKKKHTDAVYSFKNDCSVNLLNSLKMNEIDLAITVDVPHIEDECFSYAILREEQPAVFISKSNPLSKKAFLTFEDLHEQTFLYFSDQILERYQAGMGKHGHTLKKSLQLESIAMCMNLISLDQGIFLSFECCNPHNQYIATVPLHSDCCFSKIMLVWEKNRRYSKYVDELKSFILNYKDE